MAFIQPQAGGFIVSRWPERPPCQRKTADEKAAGRWVHLLPVCHCSWSSLSLLGAVPAIETKTDKPAGSSGSTGFFKENFDLHLDTYTHWRQHLSDFVCPQGLLVRVLDRLKINQDFPTASTRDNASSEQWQLCGDVFPCLPCWPQRSETWMAGWRQKA